MAQFFQTAIGTSRLAQLRPAGGSLVAPTPAPRPAPPKSAPTGSIFTIPVKGTAVPVPIAPTKIGAPVQGTITRTPLQTQTVPEATTTATTGYVGYQSISQPIPPSSSGTSIGAGTNAPSSSAPGLSGVFSGLMGSSNDSGTPVGDQPIAPMSMTSPFSTFTGGSYGWLIIGGAIVLVLVLARGLVK